MNSHMTSNIQVKGKTLKQHCVVMEMNIYMNTDIKYISMCK